MGYSFLKLLGAFIRWITKGCKGKLINEIDGIYPATWGRSYDMENLAIGMLVGFILIAIVIILLYYNVIS
jgi:hypothetical protein